ncbi:group III truncated hemoglobin [Burkholderiaceae bacterium FT117]|uniref:group III truncated hemoglobin n=1 Tax=Zeimonas sediminis TaxID=2944268 RepID=UPI0023430AF8|nr:group III truncated hemoglobin [Zeimonas sediminis]MCM5571421.1 group III truncated hemoglobin [Zeimonas sediminis]
MLNPDLCTEDEIRWLVHAFYAKVREDERLGPIFAARVVDWDHHLGKMVDFWSSTLRGTARYRGTPMPKHAALPDLEPALFHRWLALFRETTAELENAAMRERANELAQRIAESLWFGWQMARDPERIAAKLEARAAHARTR